MSARRHDEIPLRRRATLTALVGLLITAVVAAVAFGADAREDRARDAEARAQTVSALQMFTSGLENRVQNLRGLFLASDSVTAREFHAFTESMLGDGSAYAFYWLEQERGRGDGPTFPIRYAAARDRVAARMSIGYDPFADPTRRQAMLRAALAGTPQSTPLTPSVRGRVPALVVYVPVYRPGGRHTLAGVAGMAVAAFTIADARAAVDDVLAAGTAVRITIDDREAIQEGPVADAAPSTTFAFAGRTWSVQTTVDAGHPFRLGPAAALAGLILTLLFVCVRWWRSSRALLMGGRDRAERRFREVFAAAPIGMALFDRSGRVVQVNPALCGLLGQSEAQILADPGHPIVLEEDLGLLFAEAGASVATEVRLRTPHGLRSAELHVSSLAQEELVLVQVVDVTERRASEVQLVHQAEHDPLTDLLNRRGFDRAVRTHRAERAGGAIVLLDLDHFKAVNDLHGHRAGDDVLVGMATLLRGLVRDGDAVARMGGDEFAILLPTADLEAARATARRLVDAVQKTSFPAEHTRHRVSVSVGVAMLPSVDDAHDDVLVAADLAMYDAKAAGRSRFAVYSEADEHSHTRERLRAVAGVRSALAENRFFLVAQPIRCLTTGAIAHHELLLRMRERDGSVLAPGAFLGVAEEFGLIGDIDLWVARNAVAILDLHRDRDLAFHVNLSGRSLGDPTLLEKIRAELARTGVDPKRLVFEITETAAVGNFEAARAFATALTEIGCRLALDDFGAGFSSFTYLKQFPFDILKIDGEFVRQCTTTPADRVILESLVHTAAGLGKKTVAEFVEDQATEDLLRELGVDFVQGHYVGHPSDLHAAIAQVRGTDVVTASG